MTRDVGRPERRLRWGIVPALFALFCQIIVAGMMPMAALAATGPDDFAASICHGSGDKSGAPQDHHQSGDCTLCPICQALAQGGFVTPDLPSPVLARFGKLLDPVPTPALPVFRRAVAAASPRGPPSVSSLAL
ncbi:MAG: DUF2946 family protein [Aliidongia sp.]